MAGRKIKEGSYTYAAIKNRLLVDNNFYFNEYLRFVYSQACQISERYANLDDHGALKWLIDSVQFFFYLLSTTAFPPYNYGTFLNCRTKRR